MCVCVCVCVRLFVGVYTYINRPTHRHVLNACTHTKHTHKHTRILRINRHTHTHSTVMSHLQDNTEMLRLHTQGEHFAYTHIKSTELTPTWRAQSSHTHGQDRGLDTRRHTTNVDTRRHTTNVDTCRHTTNVALTERGDKAENYPPEGR